jgi:tripeptidyl-peptidase-1
MEANLDVQYIMAMSQGTPTNYYYFDAVSGDFWTAFLVMLSNLQTSASAPLVVSISYGSVENYMPLSYMTNFNTQALILAGTGVTLVASSGDSGAVCAAGQCSATSATCGYYPSFPASSPYVTALGATKVSDAIAGPHLWNKS